MKKRAIYETLIIGMVIAMTAYFTGCAMTKAYTVKTDPDGTKTESYVSVVAAGNETSQMTATGVFADGTTEDLGAGLKSAQASQESTKLVDLANALGSILGAMQKMQAPSATPVIKRPAITSETGGGDSINSPPVSKVGGGSLITGEGVPEIVILGNRATCSRCRSLWSKLNVELLSETACGASVVDADKSENPQLYDEKRPNVSPLRWPYVEIYSDGKVIDSFEAIGMSPVELGERAKKAIGECEDVAE